MTATTRTQAMLAARAKASHDKRHRALAAVRDLEAAGTPVTATAVATAAGVSTWLVYADGVREHLEAAQRRQADREPGPSTAAPPGRGEPVSQASLRTSLAVARDEIRRLRAERDKLRPRLRLQLGAEIEGPDRAELIARVASLQAASRQLAASATPAPPKPATPCGCAGVRDPDFAAKATVILDLCQGYYQGKRLRPGDRIISVVIRGSFEAVGCGGCGAVDRVGVSVTWRMIPEH